ncbi:TspO/MBR family protein [soil metagenome]
MKLFISILIPLIVGTTAGLFTSKGVNGWYLQANKPFFNPPNWIFAPVWTVLYIMMGVALYLVWESETLKAIKRNAIIIFAIQLTLNFCWSFIFFYAQQTGWALVDIIALWLMIGCTIFYFRKISVTSAWLLVPYLAWVTFATLLNFYIWKLN